MTSAGSGSGLRMRWCPGGYWFPATSGGRGQLRAAPGADPARPRAARRYSYEVCSDQAFTTSSTVVTHPKVNPMVVRACSCRAGSYSAVASLTT